MPDDAAADMKTRLRADLKSAMAARDKPIIDLLRALIAAIDNAEAPAIAVKPAAETAEIDRLTLDAASVRAAIAADIAERKASAAQFDTLGQTEAAARLRAQADYAGRYLD